MTQELQTELAELKEELAKIKELLQAHLAASPHTVHIPYWTYPYPAPTYPFYPPYTITCGRQGT